MNHGDFNRRGLLALGALALAPRAFAQTAVRLPMQVIKGKIFVEVTVNGRPAQAMVDSGASYSGLDTRFAEVLRIEPRGRKVALRHVQGASNGRWADGVSLGIGGLTIPRSMLVTDFGLLTASVLHPITVLLGADFLSRYVAEFDFDANLLTLHGPDSFIPDAVARLTPLTAVRGTAGGGLMTAALTIEGGPPVQALIDSGSESPLIISPSVARRLRFLEDRTVATSPIGGIGGTTSGKITTALEIGFAGVTFGHVPVQVTARDLARVEANVGLELLSRFHLWLDLGRGRMWTILRHTHSVGPPFRVNLLGLFGVPEGEAIRATFIAKGSPAEAAGIRQGDLVVQINGLPANSAQRGLADAEAGTRLTLTLQNGRTATVILAPYY